jgi:hypothetical protein
MKTRRGQRHKETSKEAPTDQKQNKKNPPPRDKPPKPKKASAASNPIM